MGGRLAGGVVRAGSSPAPTLGSVRQRPMVRHTMDSGQHCRGGPLRPPVMTLFHSPPCSNTFATSTRPLSVGARHASPVGLLFDQGLWTEWTLWTKRTLWTRATERTRADRGVGRRREQPCVLS